MSHEKITPFQAAFNHDKQQAKSVTTRLSDDVTVQGLTRDGLSADQARAMKRATMGVKYLRRSVAAGMATVAVASLMDVGNKLHQNSEMAKQKIVEEENLRKKRKRDKEEVKAAYGGGYRNVDFGQMAIEMFNQRIGHYKMGNSKF